MIFPVTLFGLTQWYQLYPSGPAILRHQVAVGCSKCKTGIKALRFLPCLLHPTPINCPLVSEDVALLIGSIKFSFVSVLMSDLWILNFSSHSLQTTPVYLVEQGIAAWSVCQHTRTQDASSGQCELSLPWLILVPSQFQASFIKSFGDLGHSAVNRIWFAVPYYDFRTQKDATLKYGLSLTGCTGPQFSSQPLVSDKIVTTCL